MTTSSSNPLAPAPPGGSSTRAPDSSSASASYILPFALLAIPYWLLATHLNLSFSALLPSPPVPALALLLAACIVLHKLIPLLVPYYAPSTPKGLYGATWTTSNVNWLAGLVLGIQVIDQEPTWAKCRRAREENVLLLIVVGVIVGIVMNVRFDSGDTNPWNLERNDAHQARLARQKVSAQVDGLGSTEGPLSGKEARYRD